MPTYVLFPILSPASLTHNSYEFYILYIFSLHFSVSCLFIMIFSCMQIIYLILLVFKLFKKVSFQWMLF